MNPKLLDELAGRLADAVPGGAARIGDELEKNFRAVLDSVFSRMSLVTREEFDAQKAVLERTRQKLEAIEAHLQELERTIR